MGGRGITRALRAQNCLIIESYLPPPEKIKKTRLFVSSGKKMESKILLINNI